ncbi:MAG: hypothetical protein U0892_12055 [Pirellulales bacterium]
MSRSRRQFLGQVGNGMLLAGLGSGLASEFGISLSERVAAGAEDAAKLDFGALEPLASAMQELQPDRLMERLADELKKGTSLQTLTTAGALANARTFGGQDYIGFHTFMAGSCLSDVYAIADRTESITGAESSPSQRGAHSRVRRASS